jgi:hypothetical protein
MPEQMNVHADHACTAAKMVLDLIFSDFDSEKPLGGLKVVVEPIRRSAA